MHTIMYSLSYGDWEHGDMLASLEEIGDMLVSTQEGGGVGPAGEDGSTISSGLDT